jgi:hypothetical protein
MRSATRVFGSITYRSLLIGQYWRLICDMPVHERSGKTDRADSDGGANRSSTSQSGGGTRKRGKESWQKMFGKITGAFLTVVVLLSVPAMIVYLSYVVFRRWM